MAQVRVNKNTKWQCQTCGQCCKRKDLSCTLSEIPKLTRFFKMFIEKSIESRDFEIIPAIPIFTISEGIKECIYLNGDRCDIYENRPLTCQIYPFNLDVDGNLTIDTDCTGYGRGIFILKRGRPINKIEKIYIKAIKFQEEMTKTSDYFKQLLKDGEIKIDHKLTQIRKTEVYDWPAELKHYVDSGISDSAYNSLIFKKMTSPQLMKLIEKMIK